MHQGGSLEFGLWVQIEFGLAVISSKRVREPNQPIPNPNIPIDILEAECQKKGQADFLSEH